MPEEPIIIDGSSGRIEVAAVAGATALALGEIADPMVRSAERLAAHFTGLGSLNHPEVDSRALTEPFTPPFDDSRLGQLERLLQYSYEATAVMQRLVDVLTTDDPEYILNVLQVLRSGRLLPGSGDDKAALKQKYQQASRLGVADEDLLRVAMTPQLRSFLGLSHWYMARRLDAESVLARIYGDLYGYGDEAKEYARLIEASYSDYRRHASGLMGTAQRQFGAAIAGLDKMNLVDLSGASLDSGMRKSREYVNDLARLIEEVGFKAVASMKDAFQVQRASGRARVAAVATTTLVHQAEKMLAIAEIADNGYLLSVTAPVEVINAGVDRVLNGVEQTMRTTVASLKPMIAEHLLAVVDKPNLALSSVS